MVKVIKVKACKIIDFVPLSNNTAGYRVTGVTKNEKQQFLLQI